MSQTSPVTASDKIVNELAAWLIALEDATMYEPVRDSLIDHGRMYVHAGLTQDHSGDCTNECHTCVACSTSDAIAKAKQILAALQSFEFAKTPDLEATVSRIMRIRNGMILDGDAEALIRKEIAALMGSHAKAPALDPIELRGHLIEVCANICKVMREKHGSPVGDPYSNGVWDQGVRIEQAIRGLATAVSDTSTDREVNETELPYLKGGLDGY
jgi:hypothetical protein